MESGLPALDNKSRNSIERLNGFKRKSEVQRQAHADLASKYNRYTIGSNIFNVLASGVIVFLALSDSKKILEPLQLISIRLGIGVSFDYTLAETLFTPALGFLGLAVFMLSLINLICGWSDKFLRHSEGVRLFTDLITDIRDIIDGFDANRADGSLSEKQVGEIKKRYTLICSVLPAIPDRNFSRSKERYLIKRKKSEEMDKK